MQIISFWWLKFNLSICSLHSVWASIKIWRRRENSKRNLGTTLNENTSSVDQLHCIGWVSGRKTSHRIIIIVEALDCNLKYISFDWFPFLFSLLVLICEPCTYCKPWRKSWSHLEPWRMLQFDSCLAGLGLIADLLDYYQAPPKGILE